MGTKARSRKLLHDLIDVCAVFGIDLADQGECALLRGQRDFDDAPLSRMISKHLHLQVVDSILGQGHKLAKMFAQLHRIQHRWECRDGQIVDAIYGCRQRAFPFSTGTNRSTSRSALRSMENRSSILARAARASRSRKSGATSSFARALASPSASWGGTTRPSRSESINSGIPTTEVETTGMPLAMASSSTLGRPSRSPSPATTHGRAKVEARAYASLTCSCG